MSESKELRVRGADGLRGTVRFPSGTADALAELTLESGQRALISPSVLIPQPDGSYVVPFGPSDLPHAGQTVATIPVAREELRIEKRQHVSERVVVQIVPRTRRELIDIPLAEENVEVERVAVNRYVEGPVPVREEGDVTIIPVLEEVLVIEKRLRVKEEIRLIRRKSVRREPREVELRTEEVRVFQPGKST